MGKQAFLRKRFDGSSLLLLSALYLFPLFFLLHGYNENFGLIPVRTLFILFIKYIGLVTFVALGCQMLFNATSKAFLFSFFLLCLYFFFGALHDSLKVVGKHSFLKSYSFLFPVLMVLFLIVFIILKRSGPPLYRVQKYVLNLLFFICILEIGSLSYSWLTGKGEGNNLAQAPVPLLQNVNLAAKDKPDIYFVVFDGYTSSRCLREEFKFDNSNLDSFIKRRGFYIAENSKSNYNVTPFSLASILNFNYLQPGLEKDPVTSRVFIQGIETLKNNQLINFLRKQSYVLKNYGCFDLSNLRSHTLPYFNEIYASQIDNQTLSSRIEKDIGWNFSTKNLFTGTFRVPSAYKKSKAYHLFRNQYNYDCLMNEFSQHDQKPKFVYTHLMLPHEPFYLDADGKEVPDKAIITSEIDLRNGYVAQIQYSNRLLKQLVEKATEPSERERVVIILGDHGFRNYENVTDREKEFMNLSICYFSDKDYSKMYGTITPVNLFRNVLNKYFNQALPLKKDSSVYLINN